MINSLMRLDNLTRHLIEHRRHAGDQDENMLSSHAPLSKAISRSRDFPFAYSTSTSTPLRVPRTSLILGLRPTIPRRTLTAFALSLGLASPFSATPSPGASLDAELRSGGQTLLDLGLVSAIERLEHLLERRSGLRLPFSADDGGKIGSAR